MDKSETIREWIRGLFSENFDFSNRDLSKEKFKEKFESEENKQLEISWNRHQTLFIKCLKSVCKEKNVDVRTYGYAREKIKFSQSSSDSQAVVNIQPKPKGGKIETKPSQELGKPSTEIGERPPTITPISEEQATKLTRICWRVCGSVLHAWKEKFQKFDNDELEELSIAWEPLLKPYLERYGGKLIIAFMVTAGVFSKRADVFKKKKKEDTEETKEDKIEISKEDSEKFEAWKKKH